VYCSRCGHALTEGARFCPSCGLDLTAATPVTRVSTQPIADKSESDLVREALQAEYELLDELGRGGMAIVYRARERQLEREVAIKVLPFSLAFDGEFVERFQREARTAARLEHPNIIPIYRVSPSAGRLFWYCMKYVEGTDFGAVLEEVPPLGVPRALRILDSVAQALDYGHRHGVIHRDVKPANVFLCADWTVKLVDFGLAICVNADALGRMTAAKTIVGTPSYMAPEQVGGRRDEDLRTDVWGLGATLYHAVAGRPPYVAKSNLVLADRILHCEPDTLPAEVPAWLAHAIRKALRKSKEERWQCMRAFALALSAQ